MNFLFLTGGHICITRSLVWAMHTKGATSSKWWGKKRPSVTLINSLVEQTDSYIKFTCKDWTVTLPLSWPTCRAQIQTELKCLLKSTGYHTHYLHCFCSPLVKWRLHMLSQPYLYCCISIPDFSPCCCAAVAGHTDPFPHVTAGISTTLLFSTARLSDTCASFVVLALWLL